MVNINNIKTTIVEKLKPLQLNKIILFGSYAYGTPNENSDLDICVIEDNIKSKITLKRKIRKLLEDIDISMDIIAVDTNYYQSHSDKNWLNTALYDARHKGEVLYEKS
jgi:predicted nucleotidyltransferase